MKSTGLVRVGDSSGPVWGVVDGEEVRRLPDGPFAGHERRGEFLGTLADLELLAPVEPSKIVCVARNYVAHAAEHNAEVPSKPLLFFKPPSAVNHPGVAIELPPESEQVEHEGELALVIGRRCRRVSESEAWRAVLGITCANDVTARDLQRAEKLWTRGKGFDTFCPLGPRIVSGLEAGDVADLEVRCEVNGEAHTEFQADTGWVALTEWSAPTQIVAFYDDARGKP